MCYMSVIKAKKHGQLHCSYSMINKLTIKLLILVSLDMDIKKENHKIILFFSYTVKFILAPILRNQDSFFQNKEQSFHPSIT